ncbi:hypothetical protein K6U45_00010 [Vibrio vulnificus]|nr:hypothetical protein [Vibrio vulnificus]
MKVVCGKLVYAAFTPLTQRYTNSS